MFCGVWVVRLLSWVLFGVLVTLSFAVIGLLIVDIGFLWVVVCCFFVFMFWLVFTIVLCLIVVYCCAVDLTKPTRNFLGVFGGFAWGCFFCGLLRLLFCCFA